MTYKTHFFPKNIPENHLMSNKVKGQLWATDLWSSNAAVALKLNCKHLKCKQGLHTHKTLKMIHLWGELQMPGENPSPDICSLNLFILFLNVCTNWGVL